MGLLNKLFSKKYLNIIDSDLGQLNRSRKKGSKVIWQTNRQFLSTPIEIFIEGSKNKVNAAQKKILVDALKNEALIKKECDKALGKQFENSVMDFTSIEDLFDVIELSVNNSGFELTFQEKEGQFHFFTVYFENNKQMSVSIEEY